MLQKWTGTENKKRIFLLIFIPTFALAVFLCVFLLPTFDPFLSPAEIQSVTYLNTGEQNDTGTYVLLVLGKKGRRYQILRKAEGSSKYEKLAVLTGKKDAVSYTDKTVTPGQRYTYAVRCVTVRPNGKIYTFGRKGTEMVTPKGVTEATVTAENLSSTISFSDVGATSYRIYRRLPQESGYSFLTTVTGNGSSDTLTYTDVYQTSMTDQQKKQYLDGKYFAYYDPNVNGTRYRIVPQYQTEENKEQIGYYNAEGFFSFPAATISSVNLTDASGTVSVKELATGRKPTGAVLTWQAVPNADGYLIQQGAADKKGKVTWETVLDTGDTAQAKEGNYQTYQTVSNGAGKTDEAVKNCSVTISYKAELPYYTVVAYYKQDGTTVYADYDQSFTVENRKYTDQSILFLGDSISYGSPYTTQNTGYRYSFPFRVSQLTGLDFYNAGIPGATVAKRSGVRSVLADELRLLQQGKTPTCNELLNMQENHKFLKDFDVIVLEGGANDHSCSVPLGTLESTDQESFYGAWNQIFAALIQASQERVSEGKAPLKIVVVDMFYSQKDNQDIYKVSNREKIQNKLGLTYTDYQNAVNQIAEKYSKESKIQLYHFKTSSYSLITAENCGSTTVDNLHPTTATAVKIGTALAEFLQDILVKT